MAKTITGTLHYLDSGQLVLDWGAGNFLALNFTNNDPEKVKTIKVGLDPSQGSGLVPLDEDMNGVFKITDKNTQKFVIESYDENDVLVSRDEYDLSNLNCEQPQSPEITLEGISETEYLKTAQVPLTINYNLAGRVLPENAVIKLSYWADDHYQEFDTIQLIEGSGTAYYTLNMSDIYDWVTNTWLQVGLYSLDDQSYLAITESVPFTLVDAQTPKIIIYDDQHNEVQNIEVELGQFGEFDLDYINPSGNPCQFQLVGGSTAVADVQIVQVGDAEKLSVFPNGVGETSITLSLYDTTIWDLVIEREVSVIVQSQAVEIVPNDESITLTNTETYTENFTVRNRPANSSLVSFVNTPDVFSIDNTNIENGSVDLTAIGNGSGILQLSLINQESMLLAAVDIPVTVDLSAELTLDQEIIDFGTIGATETVNAQVINAGTKTYTISAVSSDSSVCTVTPDTSQTNQQSFIVESVNNGHATITVTATNTQDPSDVLTTSLIVVVDASGNNADAVFNTDQPYFDATNESYKTTFKVFDKELNELDDVVVRNMVYTIKDGSDNVIYSTSNNSYNSVLKYWIMASSDKTAIANILKTMTEQEITACKVTLTFTYQNVNNTSGDFQVYYKVS